MRVPLYAGPVNAMEIPTGIPMWTDACKIAKLIREESEGKRPEHLAAQNSYMTKLEREERGKLVHLAFAAWKQTDPGNPYIPDAGRPDVLDFYEIKWMGWRKSAHMDHCKGGYLYVPPNCTAEVIVGMTCFDDTMMDRCFIDGWIYGKDAKRYPQGGKVRGASGRYAHLVPYACLHSPAILP